MINYFKKIKLKNFCLYFSFNYFKQFTISNKFSDFLKYLSEPEVRNVMQPSRGRNNRQRPNNNMTSQMPDRRAPNSQLPPAPHHHSNPPTQQMHNMSVGQQRPAPSRPAPQVGRVQPQVGAQRPPMYGQQQRGGQFGNGGSPKVQSGYSSNGARG